MKKTKRTAKIIMKGNYGAGVFTLVFPIAVLCAIIIAEQLIRAYFLPYYTTPLRDNIITALSLLLKIIIVYPLFAGVKYSFYSNYLTHGEYYVSDLFYCYTSGVKYFGALFTVLFRRIFIFIIALIFLTPCLIWFRYLVKADASFNMLVLCGLCAAAAGFIILSAIYSMFLAEYLFISKGYSPIKCIFYSVKMMHNNKRKLLRLRISFFWMFSSCILIFPAFYVVPLYYQSAAVLANRIIYSRSYPQAYRVDNVLSGA